MSACIDLQIAAHRPNQETCHLVVIVAAIGPHDDRCGQWPSPLATNGRDGFDQRQQLGDVGAVGAREDRHERDALRFGNEVAF
ncbi:hypothetical protein WK53_23375 [Burkholderia ubonensis]|uniref:Uncharacterized protein n=1 Tax=Burkholderia ubonensis TaxID=101571 RepID=A0AAW3NGQ2_9BURK|nr:hypothetical protein WK53_23375 [Burkholderia ubonensis]